MKKGVDQQFTLFAYLGALAAEFTLSVALTMLHQVGKTDDTAYVYLSYLIPQVCYLLALFVMSRLKKVGLRDLFLLKKIKPISYLYALPIGVGLFLIALYPNTLLSELIRTSGSNSTVPLPPFETAGQIALGVLLICVMPAIGEELMFRKAFCEGMKGNNEWVIVLLGGLFFSFTHMNLVQTVHQFVLGCILCFLYLRTRNVTLTMLIHFMNNLLALFIERWTEGLIEWTGTTMLIAFGVGAVLLAGGLLLACKTFREREMGGAKVEIYTVVLLVFVALLWAVSVVSSFF